MHRLQYNAEKRRIRDYGLTRVSGVVMMDVFAPYIVFNSKQKYYDKEESGRKPNTIRTLTEEVFEHYNLEFSEVEGKLYQVSWTDHSKKEITKIVINNADGMGSFVRNLVDVSYFDLRYIFSWNFNEIPVCYRCFKFSDNLKPAKYGVLCKDCFKPEDKLEVA